jgi:ABC-type sugar transport system substrate-binding protein
MVVTHRIRPRRAVAALAVLAAGALAACSSSGGTAADPSSSAAAGTSTGSPGLAGSSATALAYTTAVDPAYDGTDQGNFRTLAEPTPRPGTEFKVGFLNTNAGQPILLSMQEAAEAEVKRLGGSFVGLDASSDPQKQASQLSQLISQHVNVIVGDPVVATALGPGIAQARKAGIPFVAIGTPADESRSPIPGAVTSISQGFDYTAYRTMKALAAEHPGATFATMGFALPVDQLVFMVNRMQYWGEHFGLKFLGRVDTTSDNPMGFGPAASAIVSKYPNVQIIVTFNDQSAVAAATTVASSGKRVAVATPNAAESATAAALKGGKLDVVYRTPWEQLGVQSVIAAYDTLTGQNLPLPKFISVPGSIVTPTTTEHAEWVH